ncbi:hypothetical protein [Nocardia macrotermitis]|uniref:Uncharacterized protein n=1 Tax=Nocardia macrotermitis TaxID=2585198 RepID=A0A7K0D8A1_9NOCA|nr:hypothetical protein [Nocardia macrotermitis]MQY21986.1 hypothetical protein [Nocardia macrotermitis]
MTGDYAGSPDDWTTSAIGDPVACWDPATQAPREVWQEIGLDLDTATTTIGGIAPPREFALYGGQLTTWMYSVTVWSQLYTVEDFRRKERTPFTMVPIAGPPAYHYTPAGDTTGDHRTIIFPTSYGSCSIQVIRQSTRAPATPAREAIRIATILVPVLPK